MPNLIELGAKWSNASDSPPKSTAILSTAVHEGALHNPRENTPLLSCQARTGTPWGSIVIPGEYSIPLPLSVYTCNGLGSSLQPYS